MLTAERLTELRQHTSACFMALDQQVAERLAQVEQQRDELDAYAARNQTIEHEQVQHSHQCSQRDALEQALNELRAQHHSSGQALQALLGEHSSAEAWQQHLEQTQEQARAAQAQASDTLQATTRQQIQLTAELKAQRERLQALEQEHTTLTAHVAQWRGVHTGVDDARLRQLLAHDEPQVRALRERLQSTEKQLEQARVLLQEREQQLARHQAQANGNLDAQALTQALEALTAQLEDCEQLSAGLRAQQAEDDRRTQANQALAQRTAQAYEEWQRWARLSDLIGSGTGDKFRKIAQAYNLDLLVHHANAQLRQLVRRYRLKRGGSMLGLLVMDTEMGDELRSVHSLSGGETFLVSLALALGLASMASSTLKIESLFIDEGFGSLDPESLQLAMDALDGLQAQGRKVGVISHVQEMHERIPVQIQVQRQGNGLSTVQVK